MNTITTIVMVVATQIEQPVPAKTALLRTTEQQKKHKDCGNVKWMRTTGLQQ